VSSDRLGNELDLEEKPEEVNRGFENTSFGVRIKS
jgi:hypothetical protein